MPLTATVVLPFRGGCTHRDAALEWARGLYAERHPEWRVVVAEAPPGPWVKALAVMPAVEACEPGEMVVVADADVWCDGFAEAVEGLDASDKRWAIPHAGVFRLTEEATAEVLGGAPLDEALALEQRAYKGTMGGGR